MDKDANKPADQRGGADRRQDGDPDYVGPERRMKDRRKDKPAAK
ncbi:MAG: hypothetical protein JWM94_2243 [Sphingomonas bacterium]|nr:hypothetical protein [Sphingomonas bacterium]